MIRQAGEVEVSELIWVQNFFEELKRVVAELMTNPVARLNGELLCARTVRRPLVARKYFRS